MSTAERILEGAARAFGKLGYAAVRVEDILQEAGVSRPTFYKLYSTKEEVFQTLSGRHHREIRELIRAVPRLKGLNHAQLLDGIVSAFLAWRAGLGPVGRVLDVEARTPGSPIAGDRRKTLQEMTTLVNELLVQNGRPATDPVLITALIAALESVADSLLSVKRADPQALDRARQIAARLAGGALASAEDVALLPPIPPVPS
jgi:AcrR family transcriptional regulator